jgi:single-stranded DNA-binding protein
MEKLTITIDVSKIDKSKIMSRTWTDKEGVSRTVKELKLDIVPLKETKLLKDGDTYQLYKTHFVAEQQTKEEREAKTKSKIIGEATMFKNKPKVEEEPIEYPEEEINPDDIPF